MRVPELGRGAFKNDGKIVVDDEGEIVVTKAAVEPVWFLPGVAERFGSMKSGYVVVFSRKPVECTPN